MQSLAVENRPNETPLGDRSSEPRLPLILIVEDHADTRMMYRFVLESHSYRVIEAMNGEEGIRLAESMRPSLIVMDCNLPGMDGLMATRYLREHVGGKRIPILFLSGDAHPQLRYAALSAGGDEFMVKPIQLDKFEFVVERLLTPASTQHSMTAEG